MSQVLIKIIGDFDAQQRQHFYQQQLAHYARMNTRPEVPAVIEHQPAPAPPSFARSLGIYLVRTTFLVGCLLTAGWQMLVMMRQLILGI